MQLTDVEIKALEGKPEVLELLAGIHRRVITDNTAEDADYDHAARAKYLERSAERIREAAGRKVSKRPSEALSYRNVGLAFAASVLVELQKEPLAKKNLEYDQQLNRALKSVCKVMVLSGDAPSDTDINKCKDIWNVMHSTMLSLPDYKEKLLNLLADVPEDTQHESETSEA